MSHTQNANLWQIEISDTFFTHDSLKHEPFYVTVMEEKTYSWRSYVQGGEDRICPNGTLLHLILNAKTEETDHKR